ncbi:hypothetical protein SAMN04487980_102137 [Streptomyces sp. cf124]|nr:hypothetical protein SAMN04487980_102137 [Streptomyces sp. cf124]
MRGHRRSPRGRGVRGHRRSPRGRGATDPRRTRTDRTVQGRTVPDPAAPTGRRDHPGVQGRRGRQDPDHRRGRRGPRDRRSRRSRPVLRARPDPARRRTAGPTGSARRDGSPARGGSSGSRTRHHRRRTTAEAAAGSGAQGSRRGRGRPDRRQGRDRRDQGRPDPVRAPEAAARPGCTWSPCWSGSSTGTPRRRARRPRGACGTAGIVPARRRGAVVHRDRQGLRGPQAPQALRGRPEAGEGSRAAGIRNRRPGAAVVAAGVRHRPYGDRRPRTSRRNPTGVRSGRSACRRFPLSFPASRPVPVAATGRCGRLPAGSPVGEPGSCAAVFPGVSCSVSGYFFTRTVFVDRVSRVISSASVTFAFSRTVPVAASTTSTTFASSFAVSAFPEALAS